MKRLSSFFANAAVLIVAGLLARFFTVGTQFALNRLLGPEPMGVWNLVLVALGYLMSLSTGFHLGAEREIPYLRGRGDAPGEDRIRSEMFSIALLEGISLGSLFIVFVFVVLRGIRPEFFWGFVIVGAYVIVNKINMVFDIAFRTLREFLWMGRSQVAFAVMNMVWMVGLTWKFGLYGLFTAYLLGLLTRVIVLAFLVRSLSLFKVRWQLGRQDFYSNLAVGFPLVINSFFWQFFMTIDNVSVARWQSVTFLGYYALGVTVFQATTDLLNSVSIAAFPRLMEEYGVSDDVRRLEAAVTKSLRGLFYFAAPLFLPVLFFGLPVLVYMFLPHFRPSTQVIRILILGAIFIPPANVASQIFTLQKKVWIHCVAVLSAGVLLAIGARWAAPQGLRLLALMAVSSYAFFFVACAGTAYVLVAGRSAAAAHVAKFMAMGFFMMATLTALAEIFKRYGADYSPILTAIVGILVSWTMFSYFLVRSLKEFKLMGRITNWIRRPAL